MTRRMDGYGRRTAGVLLYLGVFAFAAASTWLSATPPVLADFREVNIADDEFEPPEIIIQRGDTVVWIHRGGRPHGVRASDNSFDSSPGCSFQNGGACMRNGERYSRTFDEAGTFAYFCPVHGSANGVGMTGQITVASGGSGAPSTTAPPSTTTTTRPPGSTSMGPTTTGPSPTQTSGSPPTPPPSGASSTVAPPAGQTTLVEVPSQEPADTTTSLAVGAPVNDGDDDGDRTNLLIGIAAAVVLAAAISAVAWQYRFGPRRPGGPPPPATSF